MERDRIIQLRVSPVEKSEAERKAASIGMTLSEWIRKVMREWENK
jgi:antitoxin component of RelBE/YafQ-DinJ toxin-antitoxin module